MKTPYTNTGITAVHIGTVRIDPGQTREVDPSMMDRPPLQEAPQPANNDAMDELLAGTVQEITAAIEARNDDGTPVIADVDLAAAAEAEEEGQARKTLLEAFSQEHLARVREQLDRAEDA